ncbi:MAG: TonB-dependent receptor [Sphingobium sp.]
MATPLKFAGLLLLSSALTAPAALAQDAAPAPGGTADGGAANTAGAPADATTGAPRSTAPADTVAVDETPAEVSIPGGDIVVLGRRGANIEKSAPAVVSVLSAADIARTGEGNIAGALGRVTGLSVVGSGFVYVRGLGDRYSLALLNGSPLPSPEPLKRVVPLDLFPTNIVSSSLVQKSYSVNFPGEFGGGVINLTTGAVPKKPFLTISGGVGVNTETTSRHGYTHYGAGSDWTGFDNGSRNTPSVLTDYWRSGQPIAAVNSTAIASQLVNPSFGVAQHIGHLPPNFSTTISGGTSFEIGDDVTLGVIATAGYSNKWQVRDAVQQFSVSSDLSTVDSDFERVTTDNRIVVNGLFGLGLEFGDNKVRWTNLYIRDTLKNTRLGLGRRDVGSITDIMVQDTAWYERQLIDTQLVGEYKLSPAISLDLRAAYANSQREVPNELSVEYRRSNVAGDPYGAMFINSLNNQNGSKASIRYSDLNEDLYSASADLSVKPLDGLSLTAGYAYAHTQRDSTRRDYSFVAPFDQAKAGLYTLRPDILLSAGVINYLGVVLQDNDTTPTFRAKLVNHAGYGKIGWQVTPEILIDAGVRYEKAKQTVRSVPVFTGQIASGVTGINNDYWLPAATITWQFRPDMQFRVNASKTIARPQFRELIFQPYFDPDTNRYYVGNPFLKDSKLFNAEARFEWYFARDQRLSAAGFYKRIDNPIESYISGNFNGTTLTSFANAPKADLYGAEFEAQKYFDLSQWSGAHFFETRRLVTIANYTYTKSKLKVSATDRTDVFGASVVSPATDYFRDGAALTGQSDHLVNFQMGLEDTEKLSQQTLILSYASKRVTSRGLRSTGQPDVYEYPGFNLDFVARQGIDVGGRQLDLKWEARNLTNRKYRETQTSGANTIVYNRYTPGVTVNLSISTTF